MEQLTYKTPAKVKDFPIMYQVQDGQYMTWHKAKRLGLLLTGAYCPHWYAPHASTKVKSAKLFGIVDNKTAIKVA